MKKSIISGLITASIVLTFSVPVFAKWYYTSSITLPRAGGKWATTARQATSGVQYTQVTQNSYEVMGRIITANGTPLSPAVTHYPNTGTIGTHHSLTTAGDTIRAQFWTNGYNYFTTTAVLGWQP